MSTEDVLPILALSPSVVKGSDELHKTIQSEKCTLSDDTNISNVRHVPITLIIIN